MIPATTLADALAAAVAGKHHDRVVRIGGGEIRCVGGQVADVLITIDGLDFDPLEITDATNIIAWLGAHKTADVEVTADEGQITFSAGRATLRTFGAGGLFDPPAYALGDPLDVDLDQLARIAFASSPDDSRPLLTGIAVTPERTFATDSYRLASWERPERIECETVIIPAMFIALAAKWAPEGEITSDGRRVTTVDGSATIVGRLIEGDPPAAGALLRDSSPSTLTIPVAETLAALAACRADVVSLRHDGDGEATMRTHARADEPRVVEVIEGVDTDQIATGFAVGFNPKYLGDMLKACFALDADCATLELDGPLKPAICRAGGLTQLLMPVRFR